ncbi:hypothetical protein FPZ12_020290 [Amycolatopsis acidicola]|uniref:Uncharacterized protein n=1 Tax=Amycolatopsis acidicola TaxID=2596893 RepID=A0A5N0V3P4_9PSEU|nr:hypothetical protein [Amycolatopsis acidicola]KAA9159444.1 hypothetical protein FPZ12_020290 [Amycolatopsis acidicola]
MTTNTVIASANVLDCGHSATPEGISTGFATDPATGLTSCYTCSDEQQRDALHHASRYTAYVACDRTTLTTWPGGHLATIDLADQSQTGRRATTPTGQCSTRFSWHATDNDGGRWFGINGGPGLVITLRRLRVCSWQTEFGNGRPPRYCHQRATRQANSAPHTLYCRHHARMAHDLYAWTTQPISTTR